MVRRRNERPTVRPQTALRRVAKKREPRPLGVDHRRREGVDREGDVGGAVPSHGVEQRIGRRAAFLADDQVELGRVGLEEGDPNRAAGRLTEAESQIAVEGDGPVEVGVHELADVVDVYG